MSDLVSAADLAALFHAVLSVALLAFTGLASVYVPRLIAAFERRTGVVVTDQERAAVMGSVLTGAGLLKTRLDQGLLKVGEVTTGNPIIRQIAADALARVPDAAAAQGTSVTAAVEMIVGAVDTSKPMPQVVVANGAAVPVVTK